MYLYELHVAIFSVISASKNGEIRPIDPRNVRCIGELSTPGYTIGYNDSNNPNVTRRPARTISTTEAMDVFQRIVEMRELKSNIRRK